MVSPSDWALQPDPAPESTPPEADPEAKVTDPPEGEGTEGKGSEEEGEGTEDGDGSGPKTEEPTADDRLEALERLSADQKEVIADLRRTVGRAQSIASRVDADKTNEELREELRALSTKTASSIAAVVEGLDDTLVDPKLREAVAATQREAERAAERADLIASLKKEGLIQEPEQKTELEEAQTQANALGVELANQIASFGLDAKDEAFDWQAMRDLLVKDGPAAVREKVTATIREQITAGATEDRREVRRQTSTPTPKGAGAGDGDGPLRTGDLDADMKRLREMGAI